MGLRVNRKRRSDRKHLIYSVTINSTGELYIGMTVATGSPMKALKARWKRHVGRALLHPELTWKLCEAIRQHPLNEFTVTALEIVKGKADAHKRETEMIDELEPSLNTFKKGYENLYKTI